MPSGPPSVNEINEARGSALENYDSSVEYGVAVPPALTPLPEPVVVSNSNMHSPIEAVPKALRTPAHEVFQSSEN